MIIIIDISCWNCSITRVRWFKTFFDISIVQYTILSTITYSYCIINCIPSFYPWTNYTAFPAFTNNVNGLFGSISWMKYTQIRLSTHCALSQSEHSASNTTSINYVDLSSDDDIIFGLIVWLSYISKHSAVKIMSQFICYYYKDVPATANKTK